MKITKITKDATGNYRAAYIQIYNNEEQVLEFKSFSTETGAKKWSSRKLNQ